MISRGRISRLIMKAELTEGKEGRGRVPAQINRLDARVCKYIRRATLRIIGISCGAWSNSMERNRSKQNANLEV